MGWEQNQQHTGFLLGRSSQEQMGSVLNTPNTDPTVCLSKQEKPERSPIAVDSFSFLEITGLRVIRLMHAFSTKVSETKEAAQHKGKLCRHSVDLRPCRAQPCKYTPHLQSSLEDANLLSSLLPFSGRMSTETKLPSQCFLMMIHKGLVCTDQVQELPTAFAS